MREIGGCNCSKSDLVVGTYRLGKGRPKSGADSEGAELPPLGEKQTQSLYLSLAISSLISSQIQVGLNMEAF